MTTLLPPGRPTAREPRRTADSVEGGMWAFLLLDMTVFALFFGAYAWDLRSHRPAFTAEAASLSSVVGGVNTLVLLGSSYLVVRAVHAHRSGDVAGTRRALTGVLACAAVFVGLKCVEYVHAIESGHGLTSSPFFSYYFVLTGLHLFHVGIGSVLLLTWRRSLAHGRRPASERWAESAGAYWHMVDLLWLVIFTLLYVGSHR
ncbi:cytochrome c oxidase subunit 3 [Nocardioides zeae]|uniref:Cytochrome aa3 subunit 3 n=1 Tax=Nocardioides zeae TaxID=1457234 RepID=A0A6P0HP38_9ACTN|nr:cytochrome c oxidase subunit 3 [Nocardioides zeae]NEN80459.1 cytochrome c oxidase subunit 3 family protein [Nocardioides zeae]